MPPFSPTAALAGDSNPRVSDAALVDRARGGDREAFGALVDRHRAAVFRTARAALRSATEAEDVAQEVFVVAYRALGTYRGEAAFRTWLLAIAWRRAVRRRRSLAHFWRRFAAKDGDLRAETAWRDATDGAADPAAALEHRERAETARRLIQGLPPALRDALLLAATGEQTYEEMAATLGVPAGTLKWRVSEARRLVRERIAAREGPRG